MIQQSCNEDPEPETMSNDDAKSYDETKTIPINFN